MDVGIDEKIMLMSRDEQSCLIVSYKELKHCIEQAFQDLRKWKYYSIINKSSKQLKNSI